MRCTYMFMKKHLKTNALFFIFYKETVSDFGNFGFKKPQTLADTHTQWFIILEDSAFLFFFHKIFFVGKIATTF